MQFFIREMHPNEKEAVEKLFARSLGIIDRIVFQLSFEDAQKSAKKQKGGTLIAEHGSEIVGTIDRSLEVFLRRVAAWFWFDRRISVAFRAGSQGNQCWITFY